VGSVGAGKVVEGAQGVPEVVLRTPRVRRVRLSRNRDTPISRICCLHPTQATVEYVRAWASVKRKTTRREGRCEAGGQGVAPTSWAPACLCAERSVGGGVGCASSLVDLHCPSAYGLILPVGDGEGDGVGALPAETVRGPRCCFPTENITHKPDAHTRPGPALTGAPGARRVSFAPLIRVAGPVGRRLRPPASEVFDPPVGEVFDVRRIRPRMRKGT